ncbi:unnamed protein product [Linum tenue]|uniref:Uncharacterized protein n=1 Tax=Linum tenue TaxID=586396 RepID=A0AAV0KP31_9ROSI|nr:unnamed protein product [Linum tenue]
MEVVVEENTEGEEETLGEHLQPIITAERCRLFAEF